MKINMTNLKLKKLLPHDCFFYITNPERSKDFHYKKKSPDEINKKRSKIIRQNTEYKDSSPDEIKNLIAARSGTLFVNSLILSGLFTGVLVLAGLLMNLHWSVYAAYSVIYISAAYLVYNVLNIRFYSIILHYKIEGGKRIFYDRLIDSLYELSGADKIWHIVHVSPNKKINSHGGAKEIYDRREVRVKKSLPRFIRTNVNVWSLELKNAGIFFFPDFILIERGKRYSVIEYETLSMEYIEKPYFETAADPDDGEKIGRTWLHPKKDGSADRRFRNNPQISIMLYAELKIILSSGDSFHFQISNIRTAYMFYRFISQHSLKHSEQRYKKPESAKGKRHSQKKNNEEARKEDYNGDYKNENSGQGRRTYIKPDPKEEIKKAYSVLGLAAGASQDEVRAAYLLMAKKYHPDLVLNKKLSREFEEKMKEINKAYERLKG
jgi:hypothetical protein